MTDEERDALLLRIDECLGAVMRRQTELEEKLTRKLDGLEGKLTVKVGVLAELINKRYVDALVRARRGDVKAAN